jgi:hypothetical protein
MVINQWPAAAEVHRKLAEAKLRERMMEVSALGERLSNRAAKL